MTEEIRPICLYIETCLDKKEGTRDCNKCEHHLNYWTEVMIRDMEKNITRLEQENKEIYENGQIEITKLCNEKTKYRSALEEIREIVNQSCNNCKYNKDDITCSIGDCGEGKLKIIENKINEVLK